MVIAFDIDDVITNTSEVMKDYILKYDTTGKVASHIVEVMKGEIPSGTEEFVKKYMLNIIADAKVRPNAKEIINGLYYARNQIMIVTSRGDINYEGSEELTINYLKNKEIKYSKIIFNCHNKAEICKENNVDLLVDDSVVHCTNFANVNGNSILYTTPVNKSIPTDIQRANDWEDLSKKIQQLKSRLDRTEQGR